MINLKLTSVIFLIVLQCFRLNSQIDFSNLDSLYKIGLITENEYYDFVYRTERVKADRFDIMNFESIEKLNKEIISKEIELLSKISIIFQKEPYFIISDFVDSLLKTKNYITLNFVLDHIDLYKVNNKAIRYSLVEVYPVYSSILKNHKDYIIGFLLHSDYLNKDLNETQKILYENIFKSTVTKNSNELNYHKYSFQNNSLILSKKFENLNNLIKKD